MGRPKDMTLWQTKMRELYREKLTKYYKKHFEQHLIFYKMIVSDNTWMFNVIDMDVTVIMKCDDNGRVTIIKKPLVY